MTEILALLRLVPALAAGGTLGAFFFAGLWWTVKRGIASSSPGLWFFASLLLRTSLLLTGFYAISGGQWQRLIACCVGFLGARQVVAGLVRPPAAQQASAREVKHAAEP